VNTRFALRARRGCRDDWGCRLANVGDPVFDEYLNEIGTVVWTGGKNAQSLCRLCPGGSSLNNAEKSGPARPVRGRKSQASRSTSDRSLQ
jgi:hypothetical protein